MLSRNRAIVASAIHRTVASQFKSLRPLTTVTTGIATKAPTTPVAPLADENSISGEVMLDAFADPIAYKNAQARWGLGGAISQTSSSSSCYAPIIFPQGRSEITALTKELKEARISGGYSGQRIITKTERYNQRDAQAQLLMKDFGRQSGRLSNGSISPNPHLHKVSRLAATKDADLPQWKKHKLAMKEKLLGKAWNPQRKLSREAMDEVRYLRKQFPDDWTTERLADHFNVAGVSIAKTLKSKFQPSPERAEEQNRTRKLARKSNITADVERRKAERHALWLAQKAEREKTVKQMPARIKLGAPKRSSI
ncbi:Required for respiratory growth protein 9 mitochondrial [Podila humilis]|nr:Required for respiratory growth protein 9 mitochondrial [Podila humilis]